MSKHTPGPWVLRERPKPNVEGPYLVIDIRHETSSQSGPYVGRVEASHATPEADAMTRANARLIAAAPDLLEACKAMLDSCVVGPVGPLQDRGYAAFKIAQAAIEKAVQG